MDMEHEIFLPTLCSMEYGNVWTGSRKNSWWKIVPAEGIMKTELWRGPLCYECSQVEQTAEFPISEEGIEQLRQWLFDRSEE
jgi:hypothetical protein